MPTDERAGWQLPRASGSYALLLRSTVRRSVRVGSLGPVPVDPGSYLYVGSAFGPGGLRARVGRHLLGGGVRRWHIDYLRPHLEPEGLWWTTDRREHDWARAVAGLPVATIPAKGLGASDCRCTSHWFFVGRRGARQRIDSVLGKGKTRYVGLPPRRRDG